MLSQKVTAIDLTLNELLIDANFVDFFDSFLLTVDL